MANRTIHLEIKRQASRMRRRRGNGLSWRAAGNERDLAMMEIAASPVTADGKTTTPITYDSNCLEEILRVLRDEN